LVVGCGGPDNETTMATGTDGKVQQATSVGPASSESAYNDAAKAKQSGSQYETKSYPKKH